MMYVHIIDLVESASCYCIRRFPLASWSYCCSVTSKSVFLCSLRIPPSLAEFRFKLSLQLHCMCIVCAWEMSECLIEFRSYFQVKVTIISFVNLLQWPMNLDNVLFKLCAPPAWHVQICVIWFTAPGKLSACTIYSKCLKYLSMRSDLSGASQVRESDIVEELLVLSARATGLGVGATIATEWFVHT
jgi:hypothetical protein